MGQSHAALLTHGGELYTWGSGVGARLGHGHAAAAPTPQRVHTLWGAAAAAVKCGDSASAVISQVRSHPHRTASSGNTLYTILLPLNTPCLAVSPKSGDPASAPSLPG